jgi:hypothetical protein
MTATFYIFMVGAVIARLLQTVSVFAAIIIILILLTVMLFSFVRLSVYLTRMAAMAFFNAATNPETSPFTYASALLGILILVFKMLDEAFKALGTATT